MLGRQGIDPGKRLCHTSKKMAIAKATIVHTAKCNNDAIVFYPMLKKTNLFYHYIQTNVIFYCFSPSPSKVA
jgi:hypothetical protein